jgi:cation:H+ antiporter
MNLFDFAQNPIGVNIALFAVATVGVWIAGAKITGYVDIYADRTAIGRAFAGALILGGATSLPEIATTITASLSGAAELAGTNLLGGVILQIAILAAVDAFVLRGKALTFFSPRPALLMQGVMLVLILAVTSAAIASREVFSILSIGFWPMLLMLVYLTGLWVIYRYEGNPRWEPMGQIEEPPESARDLKDARHEKFRNVATSSICVRFLIAAVVVLFLGVVVASCGEALADQSGISQSFIGATLVAIATSLPEVSTTYTAVRFGAYSMATANILGTNILELALFLPADICYREGPIFDALSPSTNLLAALGIAATAVYLWGILERRDHTVYGLGIDSAIVLIIYLGGMVLFYFM